MNIPMMTIPECRDELFLIIRRLRVIQKNLNRRKAVRRAKTEHAKMTPALAARIRKFAKAHPRMSYTRIGRIYNVNTGRVSEAIAGKRK